MKRPKWTWAQWKWMESLERFSPSSSEVFGDKDTTKKALSQLHSWEFRVIPPTLLNFSLSVASCFPLQLFGIRALRNSFSEEHKSSPENVKDFFFFFLKYYFAFLIPGNNLCSPNLICSVSNLQVFLISSYFQWPPRTYRQCNPPSTHQLQTPHFCSWSFQIPRKWNYWILSASVRSSPLHS